MGDCRNLKTCVFTARLSPLFGKDTHFFFFDIENKLDNLSGTVLSEGRYILLLEESFEFLGKGGMADTGKKVQLYQMMKRALPHDPQLIITAHKGVFYSPPFNFHAPDVPVGCRPVPIWHTKAKFVSLLNVMAFARVVAHYEKKVIAFGSSLNPPRFSGIEYRDELLKFMADVTSSTIPLEVVLSPRTPALHRAYFSCLPRAIIAENEASIPRP